MNEWQALVARFCPADKRVCNCGDAYYTLLPPEKSGTTRDGAPVEAWVCQYGCGANKIAARDHVATEVSKLI